MTVRRKKDPQLVYSLADIDMVCEQNFEGQTHRSSQFSLPLSRSERLDVFKRFEAMMQDQWYGLMEQALMQVIAKRKEQSL
jgi:hypothetical protein